jgi:hypothetical protein
MIERLTNCCYHEISARQLLSRNISTTIIIKIEEGESRVKPPATPSNQSN